MRLRSLLPLPLLAAAALGLAGCGDLDTAELEDEIVSQGEGIESASCPESIEQKQGNDFTCDVALTDGGTAKVNVIQTDDEGNVRFSLDPNSLSVPDAGAAGEALEDAVPEGTTVPDADELPQDVPQQ